MTSSNLKGLMIASIFSSDQKRVFGANNPILAAFLDSSGSLGVRVRLGKRIGSPVDEDRLLAVANSEAEGRFGLRCESFWRRRSTTPSRSASGVRSTI